MTIGITLRGSNGTEIKFEHGFNTKNQINAAYAMIGRNVKNIVRLGSNEMTVKIESLK